MLGREGEGRGLQHAWGRFGGDAGAGARKEGDEAPQVGVDGWFQAGEGNGGPHRLLRMWHRGVERRTTCRRWRQKSSRSRARVRRTNGHRWWVNHAASGQPAPAANLTGNFVH